jgi:hypothetical protein
MKHLRFLIPVIFVFGITSCSSIPEKVPELIEVSTYKLDEQNQLAVAEWESAIAAANASKKLLSLIHPYLLSLNTSSFSQADKDSISNFLKGYPFVIRQLTNVIEQKSQTLVFQNNSKSITDAIRLANNYIAESVDENARIEAVINTIQSLKNKKDGDN